MALSISQTRRWIGVIAALFAFVVLASSAPSALAAEPAPSPPPTFTHTTVPCPGNGDCNPPACAAFGFIGCPVPYSVAFDRDGNTW